MDINWGPLGQWFSGVVALLALAYVLFREQFLERRKRPHLCILPATRTLQRNTKLPEGGTDKEASCWIRIPVQNRQGRKTAKNCRVYLIAVRHVASDGTVTPIMENDLRQLHLEHGTLQPESRDLLPGVVHRVDLVASFISQPNWLSFRVHPFHGNDAPGKYVFVVQVAAEETESQTTEVTVEWSGAWQSLQPVV